MGRVLERGEEDDDDDTSVMRGALEKICRLTGDLFFCWFDLELFVLTYLCMYVTTPMMPTRLERSQPFFL